MKLVKLASNRRINNLAQKIANDVFGDINTTVGILISKTHDRISFPPDRSGQNSTSAVTIPRDCCEKYINCFSDTAEVRKQLGKEWEHIVLLGKEVLGKSQQEQINIITHEMQHVKQNHLAPIASANNCLLDIAWDLLGEKNLKLPSETNAKAKEWDQASSIALWISETDYLFKQYQNIIDIIYKTIKSSDPIIQWRGRTKSISLELAEFFECCYNKMLIFSVKTAIKKLYVRDMDLVLRDLCERCLVHRLAFHLQMLFPDFFVDCEFNKSFIGKKTSSKRLSNTIHGNYVDILVHKRSNNLGENLLCLEAKKEKNYTDRDKDRENLEILTSSDRFAYVLGFYVILGRAYERTKLELYSNGGFVRQLPLI